MIALFKRCKVSNFFAHSILLGMKKEGVYHLFRIKVIFEPFFPHLWTSPMVAYQSFHRCLADHIKQESLITGRPHEFLLEDIGDAADGPYPEIVMMIRFEITVEKFTEPVYDDVTQIIVFLHVPADERSE